MHSFLLKKWSQLTRIYCLCICISHIFNALNRLIPIKLIALRSLWKQHVKLVMTWGFFISVGIKCNLMSRVIAIAIRGVMRQFFQPGQKVQENPSLFFLNGMRISVQMIWGFDPPNANNQKNLPSCPLFERKILHQTNPQNKHIYNTQYQ